MKKIYISEKGEAETKGVCLDQASPMSCTLLCHIYPESVDLSCPYGHQGPPVPCVGVSSS